MHKKLTKKAVAVLLAITLIVASLPLLSGRLMKALASTNVSSYEELVNAFAAISEGVYPSNVEIVLANDIVVTAPVSIHSGGSIDGNGYTISVENPGTDDVDAANTSVSNYGVFTINSADTLAISDLTVKGGLGSAIANVGTGLVTLDGVTVSNSGTNAAPVVENSINAKMLIKDSRINGNMTSTSVINNSGLMVIDRSSVNENRTAGSVVNNLGSIYINNSTFAGNVSTSASANTAVVANGSDAHMFLLNATVAGNKSRGVISSGDVFNTINSLIVDNFLYGDQDTESDIVVTAPTANNLVADSYYGTLSSTANITENSTAITDSENAPIFASYDGKYPLIYDDVLYLNSGFSPLGTKTYFEYSADLSDISLYYNKFTPAVDEFSLPTRVPTAILGATQPAEVTAFQIGNRDATPIPGAAPNKDQTYYKVVLVDPQNGEVSGLSTLGTVVEAGDSISITSTPATNYDFLYLLEVISGQPTSIITTDATYELTPTKNMTVLAKFAKKLPLKLSLLLDGTPWSSKTVDLYQYGVKQYDALSFNPTTEKYEADVYEGEYDVYVDGEDSKQNVLISDTAIEDTVRYSTLTYDANGAVGTVPASVQVPTGSTASLAGKGNLAKFDHTFTGWIKQEGGTVYAPGSDFVINNATTLYANWIPNSVLADIIVRLDGTEKADFEVVLENTTSGVEYTAPHDGTSYKVSVPNGPTLTYNVIIDGKTVGTLSCEDLKDAEFDFYSVTYYGNGNTDDAAPKVEKVFKGTTHTLIDNPFVKTGYAFMGWNRQENGGGTTKAAGDTMTITSAVEFYAVWAVETYTVTLDVDGGMPLEPAEVTRNIKFGNVYGALPTTTKEGHNFIGWQYNNTLVTADTPMLVAENHTIKAVWSPKVYPVNVPASDPIHCSVVPQSGLFTAQHGTDYSFAVTPYPGYSVANVVVSYSDIITPDNKIDIVPSNGVYTIPNVTGERTIYITAAEDVEAPSGEIEIAPSKWNTFLNTITFGLFFKDTQNVTITASDEGVGVKDVFYHVSETPLTLNEVGNLLDIEWTRINNGDTFQIEPDKDLIVYAKLVDNNANTSYISSDGVVLDKTAPEITGVTDGGNYVGTQVVTVTDKHLASVTVDGESVVPKADDTINVVGKDHPQTIVATDKCGNITSVTITVEIDKDVEDGVVTKEVDVENTLPTIVVTPSAQDFEMDLLTDEDRESVDGGEDINILIEIKDEEVVPEADKNIVQENMSDKEIFEIFDISVYKEYLTRDTRKKLTETDPIEFIFEIPSELLENIPAGMTRTFYLGRVHDGQFSLIPDKDSAQSTFTADLNKFSTYVLAYKDAEPPTEDVQPLDPENPTDPTNPDAQNPTDVDPTRTDVDPEGEGGKKVADGGKEILTGDNKPILATALAVLGAGTAALVTDKKRKSLKAKAFKEKTDE